VSASYGNRTESSIEVDLKGTQYEGLAWINLAHDE
jgi:hypothetical protein